MISYSPQPYGPSLRPYFVTLLAVSVLFVFGYLLGASEGREEREILRATFAVMAATERPCDRAQIMEFRQAPRSPKGGF